MYVWLKKTGKCNPLHDAAIKKIQATAIIDYFRKDILVPSLYLIITELYLVHLFCGYL